ncbi:signal transduction histidine kinase [Kibdelosporangium banguiense]|uniref:histidine kinase n=1 Tax=Kibdelosporangium banguiense TaxID=1365924 RepID=A0ABS4T7G6_9PSEU|nr:HAMP domain-containing protein [Kibdelosporangium banguiense]MBP2320355.1 signal transduction histidine kinase [Kibdelosporangium banguiense]
MRGGLTIRLAAASALLAVVEGAAFMVLLSSTAELRDLQHQTRKYQDVLVAGNQLGRHVINLQTRLDGFVITGQESALRLWQRDRAAIADQLGSLDRLLMEAPELHARSDGVTHAIRSYLDYSGALIDLVRRNPADARAVTVAEELRRLIEAIGTEVDRFVAIEGGHIDQRLDDTAATDRLATTAAAVGLAGSLLLIVAFAVYLTATIARPVRRAAAMAGQIADGDLDARLPEHGPGEIGMLQRSFNTMARALRHSRSELAKSRVRIVAAADQERRRIERNLHDGIQQRLVTLVLEVRAVEAELPPDSAAQLAEVANGLMATLDELRELSRGIHPAVLSEGGLVPALKALTRRSTIPAELSSDVPIRLPEPVEVAAYYLVCEALANIAKHANASTAYIDARLQDDRLRVTVSDDGIGGATTRSGSGLVGLTDRVEALGGTLSITSPPGQGTTLVADLPLKPADE